MIVTYDEHGGFFDHVPPLKVKTDVPTIHGFTTRLPSTGLRVPALIISPLMDAGTIFSGPLDHTSILQLLADKFGGSFYSDAVSRRQSHFDRLAAAFTRASPRSQISEPPAMFKPAALMGPNRNAALATTANAEALRLAARRMAEDHPELMEHGLEQVTAAVAERNSMIA